MCLDSNPYIENDDRIPNPIDLDKIADPVIIIYMKYILIHIYNEILIFVNIYTVYVIYRSFPYDMMINFILRKMVWDTLLIMGNLYLALLMEQEK